MTTPSFVPDTVPSPIALMTVRPDPAAPHTSGDPTMTESGHPPDDGSTSPSSSQIFARFPLASSSWVISGSDSNATPEIGPLSAPDDTLDLTRPVVSQSPIQPFPDMTAGIPRLEGRNPPEP